MRAGRNPPRGRFYKLAAELARRPEVRDPRKLAAWIERHAKRRNGPVGVIGRQATAIEYVEPSKGRGVWRHDFGTRGARVLAERDGSIRVKKRGARLWGESGGKLWAKNPPRRRWWQRKGMPPLAEIMRSIHRLGVRAVAAALRVSEKSVRELWQEFPTKAGGKSLGNNPGGRMAHKRRPPAGYSSWAAWSRAMRRRQSSKRGGKVAVHHKKRKNDPGPRKSKHHKKRAKFSVRHVIYRSNPRGGIVAFVKGVPRAGMVAGGVLAGVVAARFLPTVVMKTPPVGAKGLLVQGGSGLAAALAVNFVWPKLAELMLAGTLFAVGTSYLRGVNLAAAGQPVKQIPIIGPALGDRTELYALSGYYFGPGKSTGVGEYLNRSPARGIGLYEEEGQRAGGDVDRPASNMAVFG